MTRKYLVRTFGCQMNVHDSERMAGMLEAEGMEPTDVVAEADLVVLNTCCIRENADNKLYGTLGHLKSEKDRRPDMEIVVGGCLAQKDREVVQQRAPFVDVVLGTHNLARLPHLLEQSRTSGPVTEILEATVATDHESFPSALPVHRNLPWSGWVTIQFGCDNSCAFCIVPSVRGPEISRPFGDVIDEVRRAVADGVTEITLLGQNVNSYGRDLTLRLREGAAELPNTSGEAVLRDHHSTTSNASNTWTAGSEWAEAAAAGSPRVRPLFADLLREVGSVTGLRRLRWTSPHPKDLRPETVQAMADTPSVCEHLHLPLQSGSDRVLSAMHRGYSADRYLEKVRMARQCVEDLAVTTDVIIGFPGETDKDFDDTLAVCAEVQFDSAYTFVYSPRPGTEAATLTAEMVDHDVAVGRMNQLRAVVERSSLRANEARVGRTEEVLVEGPSKRDPTFLTGRTRHNRLVHFPRPDGGLRAGTYANVAVTAARTASMTGELIEVIGVPTHRTQLPVSAI